MKKMLAGMMVAGLLLFAFAGQSLAAFAAGDVIRVVLDASNEYATDLGSLSSLEAITSTQTVGDAFTGGSLANASNYAGLTVAYYVVGSAGTTSNFDYVGGPTSAGTLTKQGSSRGTLRSNNTFQNSLFNANIVTGTTAKVLNTDASGHSFFTLAEQNGAAPGTYAFFTAGAESTLGALASAGGHVDFNLYGWSGSPANGVAGTLALNSLSSALDLRTLDIGGVGYTEVVAASAVPVPPSVLLLVPGLLGIVGLRKKIA